MDLDENLAAVHAYLCADGYVIKSKNIKYCYYHIGFRNTNLTLLTDFQKRFFNYFKIKPYLIEGQRCRIGSKNLYDLLTKEFGSFYSWEWSMPKLNKNLLKVWLRAYFDCEGWVTMKSHQNRMIGLDCVNIKGLKQIQKALETLGIKSKVKKRNTRNIHTIAIFGRENIVRFKENINFLHPDKKEKLVKAINDFVVYDWVFPREKKELKKFIIELMKNRVRFRTSNGVVRIISNLEGNLLTLQKYLKSFYNIESRINKMVNGIGTIYFEMSINKKSEVNKLAKYGLMGDQAKEKWLKSKK